MDIDLDYENMSEEEVNRLLREAGYESKLVGKYYKLLAESAFLKSELQLKLAEAEETLRLERRRFHRAAARWVDEMNSLEEENVRLRQELEAVKAKGG